MVECDAGELIMVADDIKRFRDNLRDELDGAALYAALAAAEPDPLRKDLFLKLAQAESEHAQLWRQKLAATGAPEPRHALSFRTRLLGVLARRFGPGFVMPALAAAERADRNKYAGQADARAISAEERSHAVIVGEMAKPTAPASGADIARAEPWHRGASGNNLRAAVLGANDGLVSNFCLVMGIAGAGTPSRVILLTGLAGLIAGACSMALGEWLSVTNAQELARTQIAKEAQELEETPESEENELALIYQAKGLPKAEARHIAQALMRDRKAALDTLAREELGIDPGELGGRPLPAAATSFVLFAAGAIFPVLPFLWLRGTPAIAVSITASAVGLSAMGIMTSLFNGRSPLFSATRQVVFGCAAAAVTYALGAALGVSLS
jgi:VIT1/CCC1 family predicted Fe2+/Mn2+ transporter